MKKIVFFLMVAACALTAQADGYGYLTFATSDGTLKSVPVASLTMNISDGTLTAGEATFTLADLTKMYFTETDESTSVTPVDPVEPVEPAANDLAFSEVTASARLNEEFTLPELTNPHQLTVTWSSSDESVATVDADGNVTLVGAGEVTITASFAGNEEYAAGEVSYTLTVDEADKVIGIKNNGDVVAVYSLSGSFIGNLQSLADASTHLQRGIYIVKVGGRTTKIAVK